MLGSSVILINSDRRETLRSLIIEMSSNPKVFTGAFLAATIIASSILINLSISDDAYLMNCSTPGFERVLCAGKYFAIWVLPYWWFLILAFSTIIGLISIGVKVLVSKLR